MGTLRQTRELGRGRRPKIREALASYTVVNLNSDFQKQVNISHIKEIKSTKLGGDPKVESKQTTLFQINDINTLKVGPQSFPASGSFQMSQFFISGGHSIGVSASASVLPMDTQD